MKHYYIFCEGIKTEPYYFEGVKRAIEKDPRSKASAELHIFGLGKETLRIVQFARAYIEEHGIWDSEIWCVFDKDDFPDRNFDRSIQLLDRWNQEQKNGNQYHAAWSNECFELWILLHFSYYQTSYPRSEYIRLLNQLFQKKGVGRYEKNQRDLFEMLERIGSLRFAIQNAKKLAQEEWTGKPSTSKPMTTVYMLMEELSRYL